MIIVPATKHDIEGIADCAERFFEYAGYKEMGLPLDREHFKNMVLEYISNEPNSVVLLLKNGAYGKTVGGVAGHISQWGFNNKFRFMVELFYWVDEEYRGINSIKLIDKFEKASFSKGADNILMIRVESFLKDGVERLYLRRGYKPMEAFYINGANNGSN